MFGTRMEDFRLLSPRGRQLAEGSLKFELVYVKTQKQDFGPGIGALQYLHI